MDIKVTRSPFPVGGVVWTNVNRWIIGTKERAFIISPQCALAGDAPNKNEVSAAIEAAQDIEGVSQIDSLPSSSLHTDIVIILATDSSVRIFVSPRNPEHINWYEVARHGFGTGPDHICAISGTGLVDGSGSAIPVVACGSMGGFIDFVELGETAGGQMHTKHRLRVKSGDCAVGYLTWVDSPPETNDAALVACAADGTARIWNVAKDLKQAYLAYSLDMCDWRQITAHATGKGLLVLAKLGTAIVVDMSSSHKSPNIQHVALGLSQTITSCVVDKRRDRIYIGSCDFSIYVLGRESTKWVRLPHEEAALKAGMRKTVVRSFTTPFMMHSLFLRGMHVSPNGRYLVFMADDQTNWDINVDGLAVTRVHFHQFDDWSVADTQMSLTRIINKEYEGELRYNLWELLNEATVMGVVDLVQHLLQMDIPAESDKQQQRRLFILNFINSTYKDEQISALLAGARNDALDFHVKSLFAYIHNLTSAEYTLLPDDDKAYLAQVNWAVSQPVYSSIAGDLPKIGGGSAEMKPLSCPICQKEMRLHSRQVALCASNHIFDTCSVTLDILKTPGSDQCNTCNAKCRRVSSRHSASLISRLKSAFPLCPFCEGHFYSVF